MAKLTIWQAPQLNNLELALTQGGIRAQRRYEAITGGWWLWHGPECYLQVHVADYVAAKTDHIVYIDSSIRKLRGEMKRGPGRPAENLTKRPDISVWHKSSQTVRAAIEIKRSWNIVSLRSDATKLQQWLKHKDAPKAAYLLVYSEASGAKREHVLSGRFQNWSTNLGWRLLKTAIDVEGDGNASWGICLLRHIRGED